MIYSLVSNCLNGVPALPLQTNLSNFNLVITFLPAFLSKIVREISSAFVWSIVLKVEK